MADQAPRQRRSKERHFLLQGSNLPLQIGDVTTALRRNLLRCPRCRPDFLTGDAGDFLFEGVGEIRHSTGSFQVRGPYILRVVVSTLKPPWAGCGGTDRGFSDGAACRSTVS